MGQASSNIVNSVKNITIDNSFLNFMTLAIIIIIIIIVVIRALYINNLEPSEVKLMNNLYPEPNTYMNSIE